MSTARVVRVEAGAAAKGGRAGAIASFELACAFEGMDDVLTKPLHGGVLSEALARALAGHAAPRRAARFCR